MNKRLDIQAMRGIAVLLVVIFHGHLNLLEAGFLGFKGGHGGWIGISRWMKGTQASAPLGSRRGVELVANGNGQIFE